MWEIVNYNFSSAHATFDFADVIFTLPNEPGCICQNPKFWLCYFLGFTRLHRVRPDLRGSKFRLPFRRGRY